MWHKTFQSMRNREIYNCACRSGALIKRAEIISKYCHNNEYLIENAAPTTPTRVF